MALVVILTPYITFLFRLKEALCGLNQVCLYREQFVYVFNNQPFYENIAFWSFNVQLNEDNKEARLRKQPYIDIYWYYTQ